MASPDTYKPSNGPTLSYKIYQAISFKAGDIVALRTDGYATNAADASGLVCILGPAVKDADNSAGSSGDLEVEVDIGGALVELTHTGGSQAIADVGDTVFADGSTACDDIGGVTNPVSLGTIQRVPSATKVVVSLFTPNESKFQTELAVLANLTEGTNIAASTANGTLTDSSATNPTEAQFNELAKELNTRLSAITAAARS